MAALLYIVSGCQLVMCIKLIVWCVALVFMWCVIVCGDGPTAIKIKIFVFRRAARSSSEVVLNEYDVWLR
jgi:hypothetical protein